LAALTRQGIATFSRFTGAQSLDIKKSTLAAEADRLENSYTWSM
jgi:hypothetical protein